MTLAFRNVDVEPGAPVVTWPYEAIVTALERGTIGDWARITYAIDDDPWGEVARQVEDYLGYARPYGVGPLLERALTRSRARSQQRERQTVAERVRHLVDASGLDRGQFARRIGTSRSRLSTYCTGSVAPSAALLVRMEVASPACPDDGMNRGLPALGC